MKLLVERGQVYRSKAKKGYRYALITSVHVDRSVKDTTGQVWCGAREVTEAGGKPPSVYLESSPLRGFRRGEPFTIYLTVRDGCWQMAKGWEREGWKEPEEEPSNAWVEPEEFTEKEAQIRDLNKDIAAGKVKLVPEAPVVKRRGRPPGSKNKPKEMSLDD